MRLELSAHLNASTASVHEHPADWRYQPHEAAPSSAVTSLAKTKSKSKQKRRRKQLTTLWSLFTL